MARDGSCEGNAIPGTGNEAGEYGVETVEEGRFTCAGHGWNPAVLLTS